MSEVTLETLRADFEAARDTLLKKKSSLSYSFGGSSSSTKPYVIEGTLVEMIPHLNEYTVEEWCDAGKAGFGTNNSVVVAANVYVIARDFTIKAALLWKLSGGAIDPRND